MATNKCPYSLRLQQNPQDVQENWLQVKTEPPEDPAYVASDRASNAPENSAKSNDEENALDIKTEARFDCPSTSDTFGKTDYARGSKEQSDEMKNAETGDDLFEEEEPAYTLRQYQKELTENALKGKNTIVCCGTGSGKTLVASHIIAKHLEDTSKEPRKVVFMAPTTALVKQQEGMLKQYLPKCSIYLISGEDDRRLTYFLDAAQVFCLTPQILVNNLEQDLIKSLSQFSLLVFDECHHAKDGPYHVLLQKYLLEKSKGQENLPQVLGLTASIGVGRSVHDIDAQDYILRICAKMDVYEVSVVNEHTEELKEHTPDIEEGHISFVSHFDDNCREVLESAIESAQDHLGDLTSKVPGFADIIFNIPQAGTTQFHSWTDRIIRLARGIDDTRDIITCAIYMDQFNAALEMNTLTNPKDVYTFLEKQYAQDFNRKDALTNEEKKLLDLFESVLKNIRSKKGRMQENPNLRTLSNTLKNMFENGDGDSRAMVFVHARATCRALASFLDNDLRDIGMSTKAMWGKQPVGHDKGMTEEEHTKLLQDFRAGNFKVLVATSVAIEGIDVPDCDIVISYKYTGNEITKIQMKGRSRKDGKHFTIGDEKDRDKNTVNVYKEAMMRRALAVVMQMPNQERRQKIRQLQQKEISAYKHDLARREEAKKMKLEGVEYELECKICKRFACSSFDIRECFSSHIVTDENFRKRFIKKNHPKPTFIHGGFYTKIEICCKICESYWGIISEKDNKDFCVLQCAAFIIGRKGSKKEERKKYKKWSQVPFKMQPLELSEANACTSVNNENK